MSGKRVLAVYAALLLGFAVVLCRLYLLALHPAYAARAAAQSTVTLQLPARRGNFYDAQGRLLTPGCVEAHCHIGLDNQAMRWAAAHRP